METVLVLVMMVALGYMAGLVVLSFRKRDRWQHWIGGAVLCGLAGGAWVGAQMAGPIGYALLIEAGLAALVAVWGLCIVDIEDTTEIPLRDR